MGTTGSGKSTVIQLLRGALNLAGKMINSDHLSSHSISSNKEVNIVAILLLFLNIEKAPRAADASGRCIVSCCYVFACV